MWELDNKKDCVEQLMLLNCGAGEDSWESPGLQGDQTNQSEKKSTLNIHSLEGLMLKLQSFGYLIWRVYSLDKTLILEKTEGRRRGRQRMRCSDGIIDPMYMSLSKLWEIVKDREACGAAVYGVPQSQMRVSNWTIPSSSVSTSAVLMLCILGLNF